MIGFFKKLARIANALAVISKSEDKIEYLETRIDEIFYSRLEEFRRKSYHLSMSYYQDIDDARLEYLKRYVDSKISRVEDGIKNMDTEYRVCDSKQIDFSLSSFQKNMSIKQYNTLYDIDQLRKNIGMIEGSKK